MGSFFISINMVGCRLKIAWGRLVWVYYNRKDYYARSSRHFRVHFVVRVCCDSVVNSVEWALLTAMGKKGNHSQWQLQRHFAPWFSKFWNGESESIDFVTTLNWLLSSQVAQNTSGFKPIYVTLFSLYPSILLGGGGGEERQAKNTTQWPGQVLDPNLPTRNWVFLTSKSWTTLLCAFWFLIIPSRVFHVSGNWRIISLLSFL